MTKKLRKPRSISEVKTFDKQVILLLIKGMVKNLQKRGGGMILSEIPKIRKNDDINKVLSTKISIEDVIKPEEDFINKLSKKDLLRAKFGKGPLELNLEPVIFNSGLVDSGVPYLKVRVTSWLNKENPKNIFHQLLTLIKK